MRPTVDEDLVGASRLLEQLVANPDVTPADISAYATNIGRLLGFIRTAYHTEREIVRNENAVFRALIKMPPASTESYDPNDVPTPVIRHANTSLREAICDHIRQLSDSALLDGHGGEILTALSGLNEWRQGLMARERERDR